MKKLIIILLLLSFVFCTGADYSDMEKAADNEFGISFTESVDTISSGGVADMESIWEKAKNFFINAVKESLVSVIAVFSVSVFFSMVSAFRQGFGQEGIGEVAFFFVYSIICVLLLKDFNSFYKIALSVSESITIFLNSAIPIVGTTMVSCGGFGAYSAMTPVIMVASSIGVNVIWKIGIPVVMMSLALSLVGNMSKEFSPASLGKSIRSATLFVISGIISIFCALIGISGIGAGGFNVALMRGVKMIASSLIPVLGGVLSESAEAVVSGGIFLKNAVGSAALLCMIAVILYPVLKIGAAVLVYKILGAVILPFCDRRICDFIGEISGVLSCFLGFICAQGVLSGVAILSLVSFKGV